MAPAATASVVVRAHTAQGGKALRKKGRLAASPGVVIVPHKLGKRHTTQAEMQQAIAAVRALPAADVALLARGNIKIHLYPSAGLEDSLLGATTIVQEGGRWTPTQIRIAARAGLSGEQALGEIVQHEAGHAVAVIRKQDRSERAAENYARKH